MCFLLNEVNPAAHFYAARPETGSGEENTPALMVNNRLQTHKGLISSNLPCKIRPGKLATLLKHY
jgi:hypothetical protein